MIGTIAATIAGAISYLGYFVMFFGCRGNNRNPLAALAVIILAPIAAMLIQLAISRSREFSADSGGAAIAGSPAPLASALKKLNLASRKIPLHANQATAHMFIVNPLRGGGMANLFSTHPPIPERVKRLKQLAASA